MAFNNYKMPILPVNLALILLSGALWYKPLAIGLLIVMAIVSLGLATHPKTKYLFTWLLIAAYVIYAFKWLKYKCIFIDFIAEKWFTIEEYPN